MSKEQNFDLDNLIHELNGFGRYQKFILILLCIPTMLAANVTFVYFFTTGIPHYRCRIPQCDNGTDMEFISECVKNAIPFENDYPSYCTRYAERINYTLTNNISFSKQFLKDKIINCENDLVHLDTYTTIVNDFEIYCPNNQWKLTTVGTTNAIGQSIGCLIMGLVSDRYGRKKTLIVLHSLTSMFGILESFSTSLEFFYITEFMISFIGSINYSIAFILIVEILGAPYKLFATGVSCVCYATGEIIIGIVAWYFTTWRMFLRAIYLPGFIMIFYWWLIPESLGWLYSKNKIHEIQHILSKMSKINKRSLPESFEALLKKKATVNLNTDKNETRSILMILKNPTIFWRLVNCCIIMFTTVFLYCGLSIHSTTTISSNKYLYYFFVASIEIPAYILNAMSLKYISRRYTLTFSLLFAGIFCNSLYFIPEGILKLIIFTLGKFMITITYCTCFLFTTELFPITIRNLSLGICCSIGSFGNMIAPQTLLLALIWHPLPMIVFGLCAVFTSFLSLLLPNQLSALENQY